MTALRCVIKAGNTGLTRRLTHVSFELCGASIFPGRKIGKLVDGYEASFIVPEDNPIDDFGNTRNIALRVKQGEILNVEHS